MIIRTTICITLLTLLTACGGIPYRIDVDQGNVVQAKDLARLRVGMNKTQVRQLMGNPLLQDIFHKDRWDYIQRYKNGRTQEVNESRVTLYFTNELLSRIDKAGYKVIEVEPVPYSVYR